MAKQTFSEHAKTKEGDKKDLEGKKVEHAQHKKTKEGDKKDLEGKKVEQPQNKVSNLMMEARKREKKSKFKDIKMKFKARGFEARVDLENKKTIVDYLHEEMKMFAERIIDQRD